MAGSKILFGALLVSGTSPFSSSAPAISESRKTLVAESHKKFSGQQDKKRRRGRKLKKKLGIGVHFYSKRSKGQEGGSFLEEISYGAKDRDLGDEISGTSQVLNSIEEQDSPKKSTYTLEEQQKTRDKVFKQRADEIVAKYKRPENVWYSPDRELDEFKVGNDAITLLVDTTFTSDEKWGVKNRLKEHWCDQSRKWGKGMIVSKDFRPNLYEAINPPGNIFSGRFHFYYWWIEFCSGEKSRYPNWYDKSWPGVSGRHWMEGDLLV